MQQVNFFINKQGDGSVAQRLKLIYYIIEYNGEFVLNNELIQSAAPAKPIIIQWFSDNDLIIDTYQTKFAANKGNSIQITPEIFLIRPKPFSDPPKIIHSIQHFIFPKKYTVELADNAHTTFLTVTDKDKKSAHDLGGHVTAEDISFDPKGITVVRPLKTILGHSQIIKFEISNGITVSDSYVAIKSPNIVPADKLPLAFIQCIKYGDYENAENMLSFNITAQHLKQYFQEFEILEQNYLNNPNIISILPKDTLKTRNLTFTVENNKITNLS